MKNFIEKVMADQGLQIKDLNCVQLAMLRSGMNIADVSRASGVSYGTIRDVAVGKTDLGKMDVHKFIDIAHAFDMTADELMSIDNKGRKDTLTPDEKELVNLYRKTNEQGRAAIMAVARSQQGMERQSETRAIKDA